MEKEPGEIVEKNADYVLPSLVKGRLMKRYKRFLADVVLDSGKMVTAHCPNSGSMAGCAEPGADVWLSLADNPRRKLAYTWELVQTPKSLVGINTQVPNRLVKNAIEQGHIPELQGYTKVFSEVKTSEHTRLDLKLENSSGPCCYVEIKNCTLLEKRRAMFPDAVTTRGQKHLDELAALAEKGNRCVIFYLVQRMDAEAFSPATHIDGEYAEKLHFAMENGVEVLAYDVCIDIPFIRIHRLLPLLPCEQWNCCSGKFPEI